HRNDLIWQLALFECERDLLGQRLQGITASQDHRDDRGVEAKLSIARKVEQRFDFMRERLHRHEPEETGVAFDRMKRAENRIERFGIVRLLVERKQGRLDLLQVIHGLTVKFSQELLVVLEMQQQQH